jgi:hypothetical protein
MVLLNSLYLLQGQALFSRDKYENQRLAKRRDYNMETISF